MLRITMIISAAAATVDLPVLHQEPMMPSDWQKSVHNVAGDQQVMLRFSLKMGRSEELLKIAMDVSDPQSKSYGQYLTADAVRSLTAPGDDNVRTVETWLSRHGVSFTRAAGSRVVEVRADAARVGRLLDTSFHLATNTMTHQQVLHADDFWLPFDVDRAIAAVYGIHGLPLPPHTSLFSPKAQAPANITPAVLLATYNVSGVVPSGSTKNRQAVAEFQGQTMKGSDLQQFFKKYVPGAGGRDSKIHKFVGEGGTGDGMLEPSLDLDYIMGLAPGALTEYWSWQGADFCGDLQNWTEAILAADEPPLVFSVSYGWNGNLSTVGCKPEEVTDVDNNFVKLATRGISIIVASGDGGSGYSAGMACNEKYTKNNTGIQGHVYMNLPLPNAIACCQVAKSSAFSQKVTAWTFQTPQAIGQDLGTCSPKPGVMYEGTIEVALPGIPTQDVCCDVAGSYPSARGLTFSNKTCTIFSAVTGSKTEPSASSAHVVANTGPCLLYSNVSKTHHAPGFVSGGSGVVPQPPPKLVPSWPASSPWVTSVGATRFIGQTVGQLEMASDSFGSGGGFSEMFEAFKNQVSVVQHYLKLAKKLPPRKSFPAGGRATPDVAALGEGFQVVSDGKVVSVAGTSASAPTFAALVTLLNEARLKAGKPAMGYLNPFLYQNADAFRDVTIGNNAISKNGGALKYGFSCAPGWDPVTGLGTPNFKVLLVKAMGNLSADASEENIFV